MVPDDTPTSSLSDLAQLPTPLPHVPDVRAVPAATLTLPEELRAKLSAREHRLLAELIAGNDLDSALTAAGYRKKSPAYRRIKELGLPSDLRRALHQLIGQLYQNAATSREWIRTELVRTYECAAQAVEVRDNRGRPTGEYRVDGPTRTRALQLLGSDFGMFAQRVTHDLSGDVKTLLAAVAARGKPGIEQRRAPVTIDAAPQHTAPQQIARTNADT